MSEIHISHTQKLILRIYFSKVWGPNLLLGRASVSANLLFGAYCIAVMEAQGLVNDALTEAFRAEDVRILGFALLEDFKKLNSLKAFSCFGNVEAVVDLCDVCIPTPTHPNEVGILHRVQ